MSIHIGLPNITATTDTGRLQQLQSYMHQLAQQLNWALNTVEAARQSPTPVPENKALPAKEAESTFESIKALIIKSADIVKAYEDTIESNFQSKYFAESDFGTFLEETSHSIQENAGGVTEAFARISSIDTDLDGLWDYVHTTEGYIKRGILSDGTVGIEVGQTSETGAYHSYARFTAKKLSFFDINGNEVAYIGAGDDESDSNCLYVRGKAVFLGEIQLGGYKTDTANGLAFTWIGG